MITLRTIAAAVALVAGAQLLALDLGKPRTSGKQAVKAEVEAVTRAIYDGAKDWVFSLKRTERPDGRGIFASDVQGGFVEGKLARILATDWTSNGKYQVEFYLSGDALVFAYETFEWYEGREPRAAARNFRGLAAWERRSYFKKGKIAYAEATGTGGPPPGEGGEQLAARAAELVKLLEARRAQSPSP